MLFVSTNKQKEMKEKLFCNMKKTDFFTNVEEREKALYK